MRPADIFEVVHERVQECRASMGRIPAIRPDASARGGLPTCGNRQAEYIADFALAGLSVLTHPGRREVFKLYFVRGLPVQEVRSLLGSTYWNPKTQEPEPRPLKEGTFWWWCSEIKRAVGPELARRKLYPPRLYKERD